MKKLMPVLSCVAMAWGFASADIMDSTGNYIDGGTAFLFLGTVTASDSFNTSEATQLATGGQNAGYNYGEHDTPVALAGLAKDTAGQAYTLILLEKTGASLAGYEGNYILVNGTSAQGSDPMSGDTWAVMVSPTAFGANDWVKMPSGDVPEPTSGLLLVLGGAMLALRRRKM